MTCTRDYQATQLRILSTHACHVTGISFGLLVGRGEVSHLLCKALWPTGSTVLPVNVLPQPAWPSANGHLPSVRMAHGYKWLQSACAPLITLAIAFSLSLILTLTLTLALALALGQHAIRYEHSSCDFESSALLALLVRHGPERKAWMLYCNSIHCPRACDGHVAALQQVIHLHMLALSAPEDQSTEISAALYRALLCMQALTPEGELEDMLHG